MTPATRAVRPAGPEHQPGGGAARRRITVVGASGIYMPGVIRGLIHRATDLATLAEGIAAHRTHLPQFVGSHR